MAVRSKTIALCEVGEEWLHAWLEEGIIPPDVYHQEMERRSEARARSRSPRRRPLADKRNVARAILYP